MPEFIYNDERHEYTLDGRKLPNVTTIIENAGLVDTTWYNEQALLRGKAAHEAIKYLHDDDLDENSLDNVVKPFIEGLKLFNAQNPREIILFETPCYHRLYLYAGTPDEFSIWNDEPCVIDYKTGSMPKWAALQTAAYSDLLCNNMKVVQAIMKTKAKKMPRRYGLELKADGSYKLHRFDNRNDFNVFLSALNINNWKESIK
jgi:hypothetical protein